MLILVGKLEDPCHCQCCLISEVFPKGPRPLSGRYGDILPGTLEAGSGKYEADNSGRALKVLRERTT